MKRTTTSLALLALCVAGSTAQAQTLTRATSYGTHTVNRPVMIDSVNVNNQKFTLSSLLKTAYKAEDLKGTPITAAKSGYFALPVLPSPRGHSSSSGVHATPSMMVRNS